MKLDIAISKLQVEILAQKKQSAANELPARQQDILELLYANGPTLPIKISDTLACPRPTVSRHLKKLKYNGYISQKKGEIDGREQIVSLSNRGHSYMELAQYRRRGAAKIIEECLSVGEQAIFAELCDKAAEALKAEREST